MTTIDHRIYTTVDDVAAVLADALNGVGAGFDTVAFVRYLRATGQVEYVSQGGLHRHGFAFTGTASDFWEAVETFPGF